MHSPETQAPAAAQAPDAIPDAQAYAPALTAQHERALGAAFAHRCLSALIWSGSANVVLAMVAAVLIWMVYHPPTKYFATEQGRHIN